MNQKNIEVQIIAEEGATLPTYGTAHAAGADMRAFIPEPLTLKSGERALIPTGLRVAIPEGYEIQVRPRSGLALKHGITVLNTPGTVDSDYRGELKVILMNHSNEDFVIEPGMRIAQMVLATALRAEFIPCDELVETARGQGGFGHTGFH